MEKAYGALRVSPLRAARLVFVLRILTLCPCACGPGSSFRRRSPGGAAWLRRTTRFAWDGTRLVRFVRLLALWCWRSLRLFASRTYLPATSSAVLSAVFGASSLPLRDSRFIAQRRAFSGVRLQNTAAAYCCAVSRCLFWLRHGALRGFNTVFPLLPRRRCSSVLFAEQRCWR